MIDNRQDFARVRKHEVVSLRTNRKCIQFCGLIVALGATVVSGCRALDPPPPNHVFTDPSIRFPISVTSQPVSIDIPVARSKDGMTGAMRHDLLKYLSSYRRSGARELFLSAPSPHRRSPLMSSTIADLWDIFEDEGVAGSHVRIHDPGISFISKPWLTLTYYRDAATAPPCDIWEHNLADDRDNIPFDNLGCSQRANLEAMVAYPSDLVTQRSLSDRSNQRRAHMMDQYVKGTLGKKKKTKSVTAAGE